MTDRPSAIEPTAQAKPSKMSNRFSEPTKRLIIADWMLSQSIQKTADKFGAHRNTVTALVKSVRDADTSTSILSKTWRETVKADAETAVTRGLNATDDPYKAGNLGIKTLVGLGALNGDSHISVNIQSLVTNVPDSLAKLLDSQGAITYEQDIVADAQQVDDSQQQAGSEQGDSDSD